MGIRCGLYQISESDVERIRSNPEVVDSIVDDKRYTLSQPPGTETQLSMFDLPARPSPKTWYADLYKLWQAVHFLLNGDPFGGSPPLSLAILGGEPVRTKEESYKILGRKEVREVADALLALTHEELHRRCDPAKFAAAHIYSVDRAVRPEELFAELMRYFARIVAIYRDANRCDNAILIEIC